MPNHVNKHDKSISMQDNPYQQYFPAVRILVPPFLNQPHDGVLSFSFFLKQGHKQTTVDLVFDFCPLYTRVGVHPSLSNPREHTSISSSSFFKYFVQQQSKNIFCGLSQ